jgi:hypothetical protein
VLGAVGNPVLVGSTALGSMVWRDIDATVVCQSLDKRPVLAAATELAAHQDVKTMQHRDDSGRFNQDPEKYPDGLYVGLRYHPAGTPEWNLDLWFVDDPDRRPDLAQPRTLPERLTDDARLAILRIKTLWSARPQYGNQCAAGTSTQPYSTTTFATQTSSTGGSRKDSPTEPSALSVKAGAIPVIAAAKRSCAAELTSPGAGRASIGRPRSRSLDSCHCQALP